MFTCMRHSAFLIITSLILLFSLISVNAFRRILLVSYRSSGSSYVGNLIQQANRSFYFYEPFRQIIGKDQRYDFHKSLTALNVLDRLFNCDGEVFTSKYWMDGELANLMMENTAYQGERAIQRRS